MRNKKFNRSKAKNYQLKDISGSKNRDRNLFVSDVLKGKKQAS